jgi:hypothetical protein
MSAGHLSHWHDNGTGLVWTDQADEAGYGDPESAPPARDHHRGEHLLSTPEHPVDDLADVRARAERHARLDREASGVVTPAEIAAAAASAADVPPLLAALDTARASVRAWHAEALLGERNRADLAAEVERLRSTLATSATIEADIIRALIDALGLDHDTAEGCVPGCDVDAGGATHMIWHLTRQRDEAQAEVERLRGSVARVRALHARQDQPTVHLDPCGRHRHTPDNVRAHGVPGALMAAARDCLNCARENHWHCVHDAHASCGHDDWPCATVRALDEGSTDE